LALNSARIGFLDWHLVTGSTTWSDTIREILGGSVASSEAPLKDLFAMVHPADRARLRSALENSRDRVTSFDVQYRITPPGSPERWIATSGRTFPDEEGRPHRLLALFRDITLRKHHEEEIRKLEQEKRLQEVMLAGEEGFRSLADRAPVLIWRSG